MMPPVASLWITSHAPSASTPDCRAVRNTFDRAAVAADRVRGALLGEGVIAVHEAPAPAEPPCMPSAARDSALRRETSARTLRCWAWTPIARWACGSPGR